MTTGLGSFCANTLPEASVSRKEAHAMMFLMYLGYIFDMMCDHEQPDRQTAFRTRRRRVLDDRRCRRDVRDWPMGPGVLFNRRERSRANPPNERYQPVDRSQAARRSPAAAPHQPT